MNPYSTPFTGYREIPHRAHQNPSSSDHSLSSPHSDSTTQYANSVSPNINESAPSAYDVPFEAWNYTDNYDIKQDDAYGTDPLSVKLEPEEKLSAKSKRIMKRNVAKERTKTRKDAEAFLTGVDPKFLPEGFDDPNLDEKTRKKMIQMVRNRISAQNSRDRKKVFMQQMEDVNSKLEDEITTLKAEKATLMNEITRLQASEAELILENQSLRNNSQNNNNMCSSCRRALQEEDPLYIDDFNNNNNTQQQQQNLEDNFDGNFSTLSSPILSRFASNGKGLFTFFTFAALVCIILVLNVNPTGEVALHGGRKIVTDTRLLEVKNEYCRGPNNYIGDLQDLPYKDSLVIRNMQPLINHFDLNYALTFKSHVQKMALTDSSSTNTYTTTTAQKEVETSNGLMMYEEQPKFQNAIVDYDYFKEANLRKKSPTILARNLPQLGQSSTDNVKTSTLFCPSGFEFIEQESQNVEIEPRDRILDLENADYLQLFVPRQGLVRYGLHNNVSTLYDLPIASEDSENAMLEIWCKVFLIRDLSSNL